MAMREGKLFGTDGVRGRANHAPMTVETALSLGRAVGMLLCQEGEHPRVVIGKDTRRSCYMFENALIAGLCSMGVHTLMVGPLPTPGVAFITRAYRADAGVVISASHNPYHDNGIKFFKADGFKLLDEEERWVEEAIRTRAFDDALPRDSEIGRNKKVEGADVRYVEFVKNTFARKRSLQGMQVVLDCANGAGYHVGPLIFEELDAELTTLGVNPNGLNINENVGALHPQLLQRTVVEQGAHVGIALDGDADRVVMVDEKGQIVDGDRILGICAMSLKERNALPNNRIVGTVMSNEGFVQTMRSQGIEVLRAKVGDRNVLREMRKCNAVLGGEQSGHIIFLDHNTTGDGLVSALQVLRIMQDTGKPLSELAAFFDPYPQVLLNVKVREKPPIDSLHDIRSTVDQVERLMQGNGRVLVRYSGTENICRVMVEGPDGDQVGRFAQEIADTVQTSIGWEK